MFHNYYRHAGGEDVVFAEESSLLKGKAHDVNTYTVSNDSINETHLQSRLGLAFSTVWNQTSFREIRRVLKEWRPDIAHFHNTLPVLSPSAYHASAAEGVPVVQTLHNYRLVCPNAILFRENSVCESCVGRAFAWPGIVKGCYRESRAATLAVAGMLTCHRLLGTWNSRVDCYIALTEFAKRKYVDGGLPAKKIFVKPNFVNPDPGFRAGGGNYFLFIGRLVEEKGIRTLLEAWKKLGDGAVIKIVGDGPLVAEVEAASRDLPNVEYLGRRSLDEIYQLLGSACALVFPSQWYEGFPKVIVEAFATGTPVIGANMGAVSEVVQHRQAGLHFVPGDADSLVEQVEWACTHVPEMAEMRACARSRFEEHYTAERNYERLLEIYDFAKKRTRERR